MKKKVVLCSPTSEDFRGVVKADAKQLGRYLPPLGLLLVAQTLKNAGYDVRFYDGNFNFDYKRDMADYVSSNKNEIIFIGIYLALLQVKDCIDMVGMVRSIDAGIPIVMGGPFPSAFPAIVMDSGMVDVCCVSDGAGIAPDIADSLAGGAGKLKGIPNIIFRESGRAIATPRTHRDTLTSGNRIFYENFLDLESYVKGFDTYIGRDHNPSVRRAMPILTGLGCSYKCAFCENALLGHSHISLPAADIVEQVISYKERFGIDSFAFFDEDFFADKKRLFEFLEIINKKGLKIKWGTQSRVNYFSENYVNTKVLEELEKSGCIRISFGVESGSPRMLKKIKKGITPEQVISAAESGKRSGICFSYS
ncbi:MAG: radical SAM protein, partial [Candidatus Omnitrophica bacterium]|nr:radical SAM protein [Candidatus Omnitrophota bacterium]